MSGRRHGLTLRDTEVHPEENAIIRHFEPLHKFEIEMDMNPVRLRILYVIGHGTHEDERKHRRHATFIKHTGISRHWELSTKNDGRTR